MDDLFTLFKLAVFTYSFAYVGVWCAEFQQYGTAKPLLLQSTEHKTTRVFVLNELDTEETFCIIEETSDNYWN